MQKTPDTESESADLIERSSSKEVNAQVDTTEFSENSFWQKIKEQAGSAGKEVVEAALKLFYALQDSDTPKSAKAIIIGALVYFIVPTDAVFDLIPGGYVDDLGALVGALWTVSEHIKDSHVEKAKAKMQEWFSD